MVDDATKNLNADENDTKEVKNKDTVSKIKSLKSPLIPVLPSKKRNSISVSKISSNTIKKINNKSKRKSLIDLNLDELEVTAGSYNDSIDNLNNNIKSPKLISPINEAIDGIYKKELNEKLVISSRTNDLHKLQVLTKRDKEYDNKFDYMDMFKLIKQK